MSKLTIDSIPGGVDVRVSDGFVGFSPMTAEVDGRTTVSVWIERHGGGYDVWKGSVYVPKKGSMLPMRITGSLVRLRTGRWSGMR